MEEKERYYYEEVLRDWVIPEGLFEIKDRKSNFYLIIENKQDVDTITNLLNQQDKRIKELEEENKELEIKLDKCGTELVNAESLVSYLENENQQLTHQHEDKGE